MNAQSVIAQYTAELYRRAAAAGLGVWTGGAFSAHLGKYDQAGDFVLSLLQGVPLDTFGDGQ